VPGEPGLGPEDVALVVLAKAPAPGRSKTRLCPPLSFEAAAAVAEGALADTLQAVVRTPARRWVLALDGAPGPWLPRQIEVVRQRGRGLDERLAAAMVDAGSPAVLIGMDTPQVTPAMLAEAMALLAQDGVDGVLGPAADGGFWAVGLRRSHPWAFPGIPMSTARTGAAQRARLEMLGLRVEGLPGLRDVDTMDDALAVAGQVPGSRFALAVRRVTERVAAIA
jgi:rSAM/selenodomain-associated transferase 1